MTTPHALHLPRTRFADPAPDGVVPQPRPVPGAVVAELALDGDVTAELAVPADAPHLTLVEDVPAQRSDSLDEATALLWQEYKTTGAKEARDRLIVHYAPLVAQVAGRVGMRLPRTVEQADLASYGMFGLIDAIEKYSTDRAVKFESYASARIRGAIIDELRAMDWVPRSVRTKARAVDRARAELEAMLHRSPTDEETAAHLHLTVRELRAVFAQLATVNVSALDEMLGGSHDGGGTPLGDTLADPHCVEPGGALDAAETTHLLARAIEQLGERERIVVVLYYYEGMTLAEIGRVLSVTESRISQMHTAAMLRLRTRLIEAERA
ncbi:FliA/WhiG family RNA polymerase sigma factor [Cellulomonas sp. URHB0016]